MTHLMAEWKYAEKTLPQARAIVKANREDGITCPCCDQFAKVYKRTITSTMARWLIMLVKLSEEDHRYFSVSEPWSLAINKGTGDVAKLAVWGLIESKPKDEDDTVRKTSGNWRPTSKGFQFVYNQTRIPKYALIYNATLIGYDGFEISIGTALGQKFNYTELMRR